ncbi:cupin domain-containing protein [Halococcus sp. IIIV-5B]|uniref:cupin domain-containing protein n=1 Tax=Halococcus sp. IIIV-5B TaxID=2321230 RepID=UPI000E76A6D6|nr:cupin domain-containing protein [Halococcus sp. IIIV-5B]RJS96934.1 cupin domain-containing protein [Halococcus sp. IIIV-5B]
MEHVAADDGTSLEPMEGVQLTMLAGGERMNVQAFEIEPGAVVPAHSHHHEQAGQVIDGVLTFVTDDAEHEVGPGGSYAIRSEERHGAENRGTETVRGVELFSPPREAPDWAE